MNNAQNPHLEHEKAILLTVRNFWPDYHPLQIADFLNAKYRFEGVYAMDARHIENYAQVIRGLDRKRRQG